MKWSLQQLHRYTQEPLFFSFEDDYSEWTSGMSDIIRMDNVSVEGSVLYLNNDRFKFNLKIKTNLYLYESRTLEEILFPVNLDVIEVFCKNPTEDEILISTNTIDLTDIIWENIILEIPIRIVKDE